MHVRIRTLGKPDTVVVVDSKLTKIEKFRHLIRDKFNVDPELQRLFYGGKLLEDGYTFHDYNIKLNDVIQLMVRALPPPPLLQEHTKEENAEKSEATKIIYTDAESKLYVIGDLIDVRDQEHGAWFEGKIVRIVCDPEARPQVLAPEQQQPATTVPTSDLESVVEKKPPYGGDIGCKQRTKGITEYFKKSPRKQKDLKMNDLSDDKCLLYKVQLDADEGDSDMFCKLKDIRPRSRRAIDVDDLDVGQMVLVNYNAEQPAEKGYWYEFKVEEIRKQRSRVELIGTVYLGPEAVPQTQTTVRVQETLFAIERPVPLADRTADYQRLMATPTLPRCQPLNCMRCRDDEDAQCRDCGCYACAGKQQPDKIVLCDECNNGYHMWCLMPPLNALPPDDWYCPACRRDPGSVVAPVPGAAKQRKKCTSTTTISKSSKDWGRGMACVGKTKSCAMPTNHFGPIPGIEVGMCWRFRIQLSESGVHRPPVSGIHGRDVDGAYSIVLSGGYEDDVDRGEEFTYTGSGGRDLSGNKRTADQSCDQTLTRENRALARNCAGAGRVSEEGADAGDEWRCGKPVRVVRSYKMRKHFPKYAPLEGIRYDGIYKVVKYYPERGLSGFRVWKYLLRRDDPSPPPWDRAAPVYPIMYPDGYLEAEAEKKAQKEKGSKKRALGQSNRSPESQGCLPPVKKRKMRGERGAGKNDNENAHTSPNDTRTTSSASKAKTIPSMFSPRSSAGGERAGRGPVTAVMGLSGKQERAILADELNVKLWEECLEVCRTQGKKDFVERVSQVFVCIICQEVAILPVTTPCLHNFCERCMKVALKCGGSTCPACRQRLAGAVPARNEALQAALRAVMPGYDASAN